MNEPGGCTVLVSCMTKMATATAKAHATGARRSQRAMSASGDDEKRGERRNRVCT